MGDETIKATVPRASTSKRDAHYGRGQIGMKSHTQTIAYAICPPACLDRQCSTMQTRANSGSEKCRKLPMQQYWARGHDTGMRWEVPPLTAEAAAAEDLPRGGWFLASVRVPSQPSAVRLETGLGKLGTLRCEAGMLPGGLDQGPGRVCIPAKHAVTCSLRRNRYFKPGRLG